MAAERMMWRKAMPARTMWRKTVVAERMVRRQVAQMMGRRTWRYHRFGLRDSVTGEGKRSRDDEGPDHLGLSSKCDGRSESPMDAVKPQSACSMAIEAC